MSSEPITTPAPAEAPIPFEPDFDKPLFLGLRFSRFVADLVRKPAAWTREIVEANRGPKYYWYHRKYPRVLPVDECYLDDEACLYEADIEYKRNRMVDRHTLELLRNRRDNCYYWYQTKKGRQYVADECNPLSDTFNREEENYHAKYGELHFKASVVEAYMKQKHRMIVERRRALRTDKKEPKPS